MTEKYAEKKVSAEETICLTVNGNSYELSVGSKSDQVGPSHTLAHTLRETLGLTGTKVSCDNGACGACTVLMDGKTILSVLFAIQFGFLNAR